MDIAACPRCASRAVKAPTMADGGILGYSTTSIAVCPDCAYQGAPLLFDREEDYKEFQRQVEQGMDPAGAGAPTPDDEDGTDTQRGDDEVPDFIAEALRGPVPRTRAPATALVIGAIGVAAFVGGVWFVVTGLASAFLGVPPAWGDGEDQGPVASTAIALSGLVQVAIAWALLRVARRQWRGTSA